MASNQSPYNVNLGKVQSGDWISTAPSQALFGVRLGFPRAWTLDKAEAEVRRAIDAIVALLEGHPTEPVTLTNLVLDMEGVPPFHQRVYELARAIPPGETLTYGELASLMGEPGAARAVGQALGKNPFAPVVPCHRVLAAQGRPGGFSAPGGIDTKLRMLLIERARFNGPGLFDTPHDGAAR